MAGKKSYNLGSNVQVNGEELAGFIGEDEDLEDLEILGFATMSTIGEMTVPRDWLIPRMEELGLPEFMQPGEPRVSSAYKRALKYHRLIETEEKMVNGHRVKSNVEKGEGNTYHIVTNVYVSAEQVAANSEEDVDPEDVDGEWRQVTLGLAKYNDGHMSLQQEIGDENPLIDEWEHLKERALTLFDELKQSHVGYDFQAITYHLRKHWTNSVPLRDGGAVAFIPNTPKVSESLEALNTLFDEINTEYKDTGKNIEINTIPVLNTQSQRQMVEQRAENQIQEIAGQLVDEAREQVQEEIPVNEIAEAIQSELSDAQNFESQYNELLDAELSAQRLITEWMDDFDDDLRQALVAAGIEDPDSGDDGHIEEKGGGYYSVIVDGEEVDSVQGKENANERLEELTN